MQHLTLPLPAPEGIFWCLEIVFGVKAFMESYVIVPVNEVIQAIKIVSVPVVAVKELSLSYRLSGDALSWMLSALYPGIQGVA